MRLSRLWLKFTEIAIESLRSLLSPKFGAGASAKQLNLGFY